MEMHDRSYEPMDIDLSAHSVHDMSISYNDPEFIGTHLKDTEPTTKEATPILSADRNINGLETSKVKKFHINMQNQTKKSQRINIINLRLLSAIILIFSLGIYMIFDIKCGDNINVERLREALSSHLYGQEEAIIDIIDALNNESKSKILFFYGGTGVGKTYTSTMMLENVGSYSNVYHYTMPSFMNTITVDFMPGLTLCQNSLVIIDDLTQNDLNINVKVNEIVGKSQGLGKNVTIILIYNCDDITGRFTKRCDESFHVKLLESFNEIKAYKKVVKFAPLREEHLQKCIIDELGSKTISEHEFRKILRNFDVSFDGCKGVYTRIKLLKIV